MKDSIIFQIKNTYRDDFRIRAFTFGQGEKSMCIVGNTRGNEYQQIFICSQLVQRMKQVEKEGRLIDGKQIMIVPSMNPSSMNIGKRFWGIDNTDINRMFPGYKEGETTQRIAAGIFEIINKYQYGIQFTSFYMPGEFQPHVRMMHTGYEEIDKAKDFGIPYIVSRAPRPYDTTTLNYNWQIWETKAFSLYSTTTRRIDETSAALIVDAIERFMILNGIIKGQVDEIPESRYFRYETLHSIRPTHAGFYHSFVPDNSAVKEGQVVAEIIEPCTGEVLEQLISPVNGVIFFQHNEPLTLAYTCCLKILEDERCC